MSSGYNDLVVALKTQHYPARSHLDRQPPATHQPAQDVVASHTMEVICDALLLVCLVTSVGNLMECHSKPSQPDTTPAPPGANALSLLSTICHKAATDPVPRLISTFNGSIAATIYQFV